MKEKREGFKIYLDQLKNGHVERIEETFSPEFLEIQEEDLSFSKPILVNGEAYVTEGNLVLRLNIFTYAELLCSMCNEPVQVAIKLEDLYHTEPLDEVKGAIFSMADTIREAILLQTPLFAECNEGKCLSRKELDKYLSKPGQEEKNHHPFEGLK